MQGTHHPDLGTTDGYGSTAITTLTTVRTTVPVDALNLDVLVYHKPNQYQYLDALSISDVQEYYHHLENLSEDS